tara:strand:+ start:1312 stop:2262 length:951 start_codon:yes stop_codon:yes gene_type:complete
MEKKILWNDHAIDMSLFKIGQSYSRNEIRDIGSLPNHLARENWTGIVSLQNAVLIFVTLDKANADKNHLYKDYFEGSDFFWESQNRNTINTSPLNRIISDDTNYLFIRVVEKIKSKTIGFTYAGRISQVDYNDEAKPIQFQFEALDFKNQPNDQLKEIYSWHPGSNFIPTAVADPTRPKKRKTSHGFQRDQAKKDATEARAMEVAKEYYESKGYKVKDCSMQRGLGYDYLCTKTKEVVEVEVKGTTGNLDKVIITRNELDNALNSVNRTDLFIVFSINFDISEQKIKGVNGTRHILKDWSPKTKDLEPISYNYFIR